MEESITTRIFLLRSSNVTSIMIVSLKWVDPPKNKKNIRKFGRWKQDYSWVEGELKLIIDEYAERKNLPIEKLIDTLNKFDVPVVSYENDLLRAKINKFEAIEINVELPEELKVRDQQEIRDVISHLNSNKKIINESGCDLTGTLARDNLAIAVKVFKKDLVAEIHQYQESNSLKSDPV